MSQSYTLELLDEFLSRRTFGLNNRKSHKLQSCWMFSFWQKIIYVEVSRDFKKSSMQLKNSRSFGICGIVENMTSAYSHHTTWISRKCEAGHMAATVSAGGQFGTRPFYHRLFRRDGVNSRLYRLSNIGLGRYPMLSDLRITYVLKVYESLLDFLQWTL